MDALTLKRRFIELFNASGWSQAETARRMDMTRGGVNGIVTGPTQPSPATVRFLEMLMLEAGVPIPGRPAGADAASRAEAAGAIPAPVAELVAKLKEIHASNPREFEAVKTMIESVRSGVKARPLVVSYGTKPAGKRLLGKAAASVRKPVAGSGA